MKILLSASANKSEPIGSGGVGPKVIIRNTNPANGANVWLYNAARDGWPNGADDAAKLARVIAEGDKIGPGTAQTLENANGITLSDFYIAADAGSSADVRVTVIS